MDTLKTIETANKNLRLRFGTRHKDIEMSHIEAVYNRNLLSIEADAKTTKGSKNGYLTGILYLAPSNVSGINTCPSASTGCAAACLFEAGRGIMYPVFYARVLKTIAFYLDASRFEASLQKSIDQLKTKAKNKGMIPIVRLNGTSDILWERRTKLIQNNPDIQFYDYTKVTARFKTQIPDNYDLTYSLHETNQVVIRSLLSQGARVAVVFDHLPTEYWNAKVVPGDQTDLRFLDDHGVIVGLVAKGPAKRDKSGFVQKVSYIDNLLKSA